MFLQYILKPVRARFATNVVRNMSRSLECVAGSKAEEKSNNTSYQYEEAINALNTLQSNADAIRQSQMNKKLDTIMDEFSKYLHRSGTSLEELDKISFIHVSGTKGKGSTCALVESMLRSYGMRTGFFSSPHLVSVTERIRINGRAISEAQFTKKFWKVFKKLESQKEFENDMPMYFKFLTILCFHIFLQEKVDVAILEVGIGGLYDCTNIIRNTPVVGITSLGIDHTNVLGNTIEDIARQKAGIIKTKSEVYTNVTQPSCLNIIKEEALRKNAIVFQVPDITQYHWPQNIEASSFNKIIELNGSLAIQIAHSWLKKFQSDVLKTAHGGLSPSFGNLSVSKQDLQGLLNCSWPGRYQVMDFYNFRIHLDGAHTIESMDICSSWFKSVTKESFNPKILIFNSTGERDSKTLLKILSNRVGFTFACFVPNIPFKQKSIGSIHSVCNSAVDQLQRARCHESNWREFISESDECGQVFETIFEAFAFLKNKFDNQKVDVLVTGSIHLLGATILALNEFKKEFVKSNHLTDFSYINK